MNWALRIKRYRERTGLTQEALATLFGVDARSVRRWESGQGRPAEAVRKKLMATPVPPITSPGVQGIAKLVQSSPLFSVLLDERHTVIAASRTYSARMAHTHGPDWQQMTYLKTLPTMLADIMSSVYQKHGGLERMLNDGLSAITHDFFVPASARSSSGGDKQFRGIGSRLWVDQNDSVIIHTSFDVPGVEQAFLVPQMTFLGDVVRDE